MGAVFAGAHKMRDSTTFSVFGVRGGLAVAALMVGACTSEVSSSSKIVTDNEGNAIPPPVVPLPPVVSLGPPMVVSLSPAPDSEAWVRDPIRAVFSEPLDPKTVTPEAIRLLDDQGAALSFSVVLSPDRTMLTLVPAAPLTTGQFKVELADTIADPAGRGIAALSWSWAVPIWQSLDFEPVKLDRFPGQTQLLVDTVNRPVIVTSSYLSGESGASDFRLDVARWENPEWASFDEVPGVGNNQTLVSLGLDLEGDPILAIFSGDENGFRLDVIDWDGERWRVLESPTGTWNPSLDSERVDATSLVTDSSGAPIVSFRRAGQLHVRRWAGETWSDLTASLDVLGASTQVFFALGADDQPFALVYNVDVRTLTVFVWEDEVWTQSGSVLPIGRLSMPPIFAVNPKGVPHVALVVDVGAVAGAVSDPVSGPVSVVKKHLAVARMTEGAWAFLGSASDFSDAEPRASNLVFGADDNPVLGWTAFSLENGYEIARVAEWDGISWQHFRPAFFGPRYRHQAVYGSLNAVAVDRYGDPVVASVPDSASPLDVEDMSSLLRWEVSVARYNNRHGAAVPAPLNRADSSLCTIPEVPPERLSETRCFNFELESFVPGVPPAEGVIPYDINSPLWSDGTLKRRYMVVPPGTSIGYTAEGPLDFPIGTILVKEFLVRDGNDQDLLPVEVRFLTKRSEDVWDGYTYAWNDEGTDADLLVDVLTTTRSYTTPLGEYVHQFPSRSDCSTCHNGVAGFVLGPRAAQMNRRHVYAPDLVDDQLETLDEVGLFGSTFPPANDLAAIRMPDPSDPTQSLEDRARAYLHSNCSHCHQPDRVSMDLRWETELQDTGLCARVTPGDPDASFLITRMTTRPGGMPPLGTFLVDPLGSGVVSDWVAQMELCP